MIIKVSCQLNLIQNWFISLWMTRLIVFETTIFTMQSNKTSNIFRYSLFSSLFVFPGSIYSEEIRQERQGLITKFSINVARKKLFTKDCYVVRRTITYTRNSQCNYCPVVSYFIKWCILVCIQLRANTIISWNIRNTK